MPHHQAYLQSLLQDRTLNNNFGIGQIVGDRLLGVGSCLRHNSDNTGNIDLRGCLEQMQLDLTSRLNGYDFDEPVHRSKCSGLDDVEALVESRSWVDSWVAPRADHWVEVRMTSMVELDLSADNDVLPYRR